MIIFIFVILLERMDDLPGSPAKSGRRGRHYAEREANIGSELLSMTPSFQRIANTSTLQRRVASRPVPVAAT